MTDEEYGRRWALENGVGFPTKCHSKAWLWYDPEYNGYPTIHHSLSACLDAAFYPSENAAFADLGRAVREIHREIPQLKEANL